MISSAVNIHEKSLKKELYRKAIHISSLWIPLVIYCFPKKETAVFLAVLLGINLITEYCCYKKIPWARDLYEKLFVKTLRGKEICKSRFIPSGSVYVLTAALSCVLLFSKEIAVIALTVMLVSDACAAIFGKTFGSRKLYASKSVEGSTIFFVSAFFVMVLYNSVFALNYAGLAACCAATLCELYDEKIKIDDNLSVPLIIGLILSYA